LNQLSLQTRHNDLLMDVQFEKAIIIKRLEEINDESLIKTFKNLLDYALKKEQSDELLDASLNRGLSQSLEGETRTHENVMKDVREKYKI